MMIFAVVQKRTKNYTAHRSSAVFGAFLSSDTNYDSSSGSSVVARRSTRIELFVQGMKCTYEVYDAHYMRQIDAIKLVSPYQ